MPGPSVKEQSKQLNPERHSNWWDGVKAGVIGGAVAGIPFAMAVGLFGSAIAGAVTNSVTGMALGMAMGFGIVIFQWACFGAFVGAVAGQMAILRYQMDLTRLAVAMTVGWYVLDEVLLGLSVFSLNGIMYGIIWGSIMGGLLGYMIGWADRTWFKKSKSHFDKIRRGEKGGDPSAPGQGSHKKKVPLKILPEAPKGEPPVGHKICGVPKNLSPLLAACKEGSRIKVEQLLSTGETDLFEKTPKRKLSAMHIAAFCGVMDVADCLISRGLKVDDLADRSVTPLYLAIQTANMNMAGYLLNKGANIHHVNDDGFTPLHWACCAPHEQLVGSTRVKMVDMLLQHGADIQQKDGQGRTPRDLAYLYELKELGTALDEHLGIEPESKPGPVKPIEEDAINVTSVEHLDQTEFADQTAFVAETASYQLGGTDVWKIPNDVSPIYQAIKEGDPHKAQLQYAEAGADPATLKEKVGAGLTAIHIASIVGAMGVVDLLVKSGTNVNEPCDHGMTPLFLAVQCNNTNVVGYLITKGADINHQNADGLTPFHFACALEDSRLKGKVRIQMLEILMQHGANIYQTTNEDMTARQLAELTGHDNVVEWLDSVSKPDDAGGDCSDDDDDYGDDDDYHL
jgi:ankyrin repeat protein